MAKSRKDLKMGDKWKKSMGVSESYEEGTDEYTKYVKETTPGQGEVEVDEANLNDYVAKFKQKMGKTTHQTMTDWVDGIG